MCVRACVLMCRGLCDTENPQLTQFQTCNLKKSLKKTEIVTYLELASIFSLAVLRAQLDEGDGRIMLGDSTGGEADQVPVCWCLDCNWTHLCIHIRYG